MTDADLSNAAFPFGTSRENGSASAPVRDGAHHLRGRAGLGAVRATEFALGVYDAIVAAGQPGLRHAGYHAMDSAHGEGVPVVGPRPRLGGHAAEAGLRGRLREATAFIGRDALLPSARTARRADWSSSRWTIPEPLLYHDEPVWRDGPVGRITSGAYGHTLGRAVGLGYVSTRRRHRRVRGDRALGAGDRERALRRARAARAAVRSTSARARGCVTRRASIRPRPAASLVWTSSALMSTVLAASGAAGGHDEGGRGGGDVAGQLDDHGEIRLAEA